MRESVSQSLDKSVKSSLETLKRAVNAVRDFFFSAKFISSVLKDLI